MIYGIDTPIIIWANGKYIDYINKAIDLYHQNINENILFDVIELSSSQIQTRLQNDNIINLPNLVLVNDKNIKRYLKSYHNKFRCLNDDIQTNQYNQNKQTNISSYNNNVYAVPLDSDPACFYYILDLVQGTEDELDDNPYKIDTYEYNDINYCDKLTEINGLRIKKGSKNYFYDNERIILEVNNQNNKNIYYYYDDNGIIGFNYDGIEYYYNKNILGDIVEIYDKYGIIKCRYEYDAWGNHIIYDEADNIVSDNSTNIGNINPFRYRGYYYDKETQLFYCNSRYYSPELCRFISLDSVNYLDPTSINGLNLYAYCNNDPVNNVDPTGHSVIAAIIGLLIATVAIIYVVEQTIRTQQYINENYDGWNKFWLTTSNFTLGFGITSIISFDADKIKYIDKGDLIIFDYSKNKNYNIFTSFQFSNAISKNGLPKGRTKGGIWFELLGHHLFNSFDLFDIIQNDNQADMGTFENDNNAWIWELFF